MPWPGAGGAPYYNVIGLDPQLLDPEQGDFRLQPGSPALGYGCRVFPPPRIGGPAAPGSEVDGVRFGPESGMNAASLARAGRGLITVSGSIAADTAWNADTVLVTGEIVIENGVTLEIAPGTRILFAGWYALAVEGRLLALGTPSTPIRFDSLEPELFQPDWTVSGAWGGLRFHETLAANGLSRLEWCEVAHAKGVDSRRQGGALSMIGCSVLAVRNCVFRENVAEYGSVLYAERSANPLLTGCLLHDNYGLIGGSALFLVDSYPRLFQCTIYNNPSLNDDIFYDTAAIHTYHSKPTIEGCILYENYSSYFLPIQIREGKPFYTRWSDIQYGMDGEGDFDLPPQFIGAGDHPYALGPQSPCVDAGPPDTDGDGLLPVDLAGLPRVAQGRIDVGAYEWSDPAGIVDELPGHSGPRGLRAEPNPAAGDVTIRFALRQAAPILLTLHDVHGRQLGRLPDGMGAAGYPAVRIDAPRCGRPRGATGTAGRASRSGSPGAGVFWVRLSRAGAPPEAIRIVRLR